MCVCVCVYYICVIICMNKFSLLVLLLHTFLRDSLLLIWTRMSFGNPSKTHLHPLHPSR